MPPDPEDLAAALQERRQAQYVVDHYGAIRGSYNEWHKQLLATYSIYRGDWDVVWPDDVVTRALPKIVNLVQLAADDRARAVASLRPSIIRRPSKPGDPARAAADKVERITNDWLRRSRVWGAQTQRWAHDAMAGGVAVTKVWMDTSKPRDERYPTFAQVDPAKCFPDPLFARGPQVDSMIVAYEEKLRVLSRRYKASFDWREDPNVSAEVAQVIEFYDPEWVIIVAETVPKMNMSTTTKRQVTTLVQERHGLGCTPFALGARPTMDGFYRGEFFGSFGVLNFANQMRTLMLDDAVHKVYPQKLHYNVENPHDDGPGADLELQSPDARFEYVQQPNQPFSNLQIQRDLMGELRSGVILPPARSGDPNESIISAAGIGAANSQFVEDVRAIQRDILAQMFEEAIYIGGRWDHRFGDVRKPIGSTGQTFAETYTPSKDVPEDLRVEVRYGMGAGLDEINTNVMVLQQWGGGNGLISRRTAQEQSPFVEDPQREEKQQLQEQLLEALKAGLIQQAAAGALTARDLAHIIKMVESDGVSLADAVAMHAPLAAAPLTAPATATPGAAEAPGIAGAAEPQQALIPPGEELVGAF